VDVIASILLVMDIDFSQEVLKQKTAQPVGGLSFSSKNS
jgi:hypothetical protein